MKQQHPDIATFLVELQGMTVAELVDEYHLMFGKPPRSKNKGWMRNRIAWEEQTRRFGGMRVAAMRRIDELKAQLQLPPAPSTQAPRAPQAKAGPPVGTRLERRWKDRTLVAIRVEGGWELDGTRYRSLSGAAKAATGSHVSGPAFFGLAKTGGRS